MNTLEYALVIISQTWNSSLRKMIELKDIVHLINRLPGRGANAAQLPNVAIRHKNTTKHLRSFQRDFRKNPHCKGTTLRQSIMSFTSSQQN